MTLLSPDLDQLLPENSYEGFERRMIHALGATVGGSSLSKALGYPSQDAFRKAFQRGLLPVPTFSLKGRRGRFAAAVDIAQWLWFQRDAPHPKQTTKLGGAP